MNFYLTTPIQELEMRNSHAAYAYTSFDVSHKKKIVLEAFVLRSINGPYSSPNIVRYGKALGSHMK